MKRILTVALFFLAVGVGAVASPLTNVGPAVHAIGDSWQQVAVGGDAPPTARQGHSAVWDPTGQRMLVFGGRGPDGQPLSDLWEYTFLAGWHVITPDGTSAAPIARSDHVAVWDIAQNRMLVFGGTSAAFDYGMGVGFLGDLWEYSDAGGWRLLIAEGLAGNPERQFGAAAAWDAVGNRMLVFSGETDTGMCYDNTGYTYPGTRDRKDVWAFNDDVGWTKLTPSMAFYCQALPGPTIRIYASAAWDAENSRLLVFGGWTPGLLHRWDLWAFYPATATWSQLQDIPSIPSTTYDTNRIRHRAVWDSSQNRMLMFGGDNAHVDPGFFNDLWEYRADSGWQLLTAQGAPTSPPPVTAHSMVWDSSSHRLLVLAGQTQTGVSDQLWSFGPPVPLDGSPPTINCTTPSTDPWHPSDVTAICAASDAESGLANASDATFTLTTSGEGAALLTDTRSVCDVAGNCALAGPLGPYKVDMTLPVVTCTAPDITPWYNADVLVPCSASDVPSGLGDAENVAFSLTTTGEGAALLTERRSICDFAGNCSLAGPFGPYKLDKTPPTITVLSPADLSVNLAGLVLSFAVEDTGSGAAWSTATLSDGSTVTTIVSGHVVAQPGVYTLTVAASDGAGNPAEQSVYFVVYDPEGGFVTGSGWFNSPLGAYLPAPAVVGKAFFGFVSRYQNGQSVPTGTTQFRFQAAGLEFQSTAFDWMVISGPKVQLRGVGTIAGLDGTFKFRLTAADGNLAGGGGPDRVRIQIWDTNGMVYDNQVGAPDGADASTAIQGGSITIHKP